MRGRCTYERDRGPVRGLPARRSLIQCTVVNNGTVRATGPIQSRYKERSLAFSLLPVQRIISSFFHPDPVRSRSMPELGVKSPNEYTLVQSCQIHFYWQAPECSRMQLSLWKDCLLLKNYIRRYFKDSFFNSLFPKVLEYLMKIRPFCRMEKISSQNRSCLLLMEYSINSP